jgi:hypothetical protein
VAAGSPTGSFPINNQGKQMETKVHPTVRSLLDQLESECATPDVWRSLRSAGRLAEDDMLAKAREAHPFETYDIVMSARAGAAQDLESGGWLTGYQFTIAHFYAAADQTAVGNSEVTFFLAFNADGKINEVVPEEEFRDFKPIHASN